MTSFEDLWRFTGINHGIDFVNFCPTRQKFGALKDGSIWKKSTKQPQLRIILERMCLYSLRAQIEMKRTNKHYTWECKCHSNLPNLPRLVAAISGLKVKTKFLRSRSKNMELKIGLLLLATCQVAWEDNAEKDGTMSLIQPSSGENGPKRRINLS